MENFNIILRGVGGQGIITLINILDEAAFIEGRDVKSSELHGLSQRGGSVEAHVRFGNKINSPLVSASNADLIIGLEQTEALRGAMQVRKETKLLINDCFMPFDGGPKKEEVLNILGKFANLHLVKASEICKEKLQNEVVGGVCLLGYGAYKKIIPLKPESFLKAIEKVIPQKYLQLNKQAFELFNHE